MKTSKAGLKLIKHYEGCRLRSYQDPAGVWTIGYGHTRGVKPNQQVTLKQADKLLEDDLRDAEEAVSRFGHFTQNQFDALVSFTFNLGPGWTRRSGLKTKLQAKDWARVPMELTKWVHAGGRPLKGLARRRVAEAMLFIS